jgi:2-oxoacid:acceptor oxidoreductase gamma subunit (pyruvate/2-ketoisovalerate family)
MIELTIFGRGGQGGVTLAKLIATAYFLRGKHVQAFGVYAAERSGAPLQAYVRADDEEITNHNQIREPDHVIVLDRTLIGPQILTGLKPDGWIILNSPDAPGAFSDRFGGRRVATVDATAIAVANGLGTRTVPIVNTTMLGAAAHLLDLSLQDIDAALAEVKFGGPNVASAREAYERVRMEKLPGAPVAAPSAASTGPVAGILDDDLGRMPLIKTGSWATRKPERRRLTPPCNNGCPAGNDVRGFVEAVGREDYDRALAILLETSPLPGVCGRVCPAPCMEACNRRVLDESVNIRDLERYAADHGQRPEPTRPSRDEPVAVVGSGPAGLSAAYHLARLGYPVTLFEGNDELGGVLRTGIPTYRLPRDILAEDVGYILKHGVKVKTGTFVDRATLLTLSREFAAVFVGTGLQDSRTLNLGSMAKGLIEQGIDFLDRTRRGRVRLDGEHVVVVGGGNTAIDAARSARRVGARRVRIVYRRTRDQMPAIKEEIDEALQEGIALDELVMPMRLRCDGLGSVLTCGRMRLGEPDESGRPRPVPDTSEDANFDLRCDRLILALGQTSNVSILPEGSEIREDGALLGLSGAPIFAGGDFATYEGTVCAAIGSGRKGAWHVHRTLAGEDLFPAPAEPEAAPEVITMHLFNRAPREESAMLPSGERRHSFMEVRLGLLDTPDRRPAVTEALRCFSCGVCNRCDRCIDYCPEGIVLRNGDGYRVDYGYCKGCGICASECPRGVIYMSEL